MSIFALVLNPNGTVLELPGQVDNANIYKYNYNYAKRVSGISSIVAVAAGDGHRMALRSDGTVWTWGNNDRGQLGQGNYSELPPNSPAVKVPSLNNIIAISAGSDYSLALDEDGTVWAWGDNFWGQIGTANLEGSRSSPLEIAYDIKAISAGWYNTLFIKNDSTSTLWTCGAPHGPFEPISGLITQVQGIQNVSHAAAGREHGLALVDNGTSKQAWTWGMNSFGELGDPSLSTWEHADDGDYYLPTRRDTPTLVLDNVVKIAAGAAHCAVQKTDGSIWTWGFAEGITELAYMYWNGTNTPVEVQGATAPVTLVAGDHQTWAAFPSPGPVGDIRKMSNADFNASPALAPSMEFGSIKIPLGDYESPQLRKITGSSIIGTTLVTPRNHTVWAAGNALYTQNPSVFTPIWGVASVSQGSKRGTTGTMWDIALVNGEYNTPYSPFGKLVKWKRPISTYPEVPPTLISGIDQVAAIDSATLSHGFLALKGNGTVWMLDSAYNPTQTAGWYGAGFTPLNVTALNSEKVVQISAGLEHFAALTDKGEVFTWGQGRHGQLGNGSFVAPANPAKASISDVASVYCGRLSTHVIKRDGSVWAWGTGALGGTVGGAPMTANFQTAIPVELTNLSNKVVSFAHSAYAMSFGSIQYAPHSLAITRTGKVLAWGSNNYGQLGLGSLVSQLVPQEIPNLSNVVEAVAGNQTSFFRTEDGTIFSCGLNSRGELGDNTLVNRLVPTETLFPFENE